MMKETEILKLVRENERMKMALLAIGSYCQICSIGSWRGVIFGIIRQAGIQR